MKRKMGTSVEKGQKHLQALTLNPQREKVSSKRTLLFVLLQSSLTIACGPTIPQLRAKASSDLSCPSSELELAQMKAGKMHVSGCGLEAIYAKSCQEGEKCAWSQEKAGRTGDL